MLSSAIWRNSKFQIPKIKWFDKPFDRLMVLSRVEGLTTLGQPVESLKVERVQGPITMTEIQNPKQGYDINPATKLVLPAAAERRAGIQKKPCYYWIPAFAGMTIR